MAWSTRELAQLAGTTVRAVRHYHKVGLLEEPQRCTNGYKQYGVGHLERTLRIRRLSDLGLSLTEVADLGDDDQYPHDALRHLDMELAHHLQHLRRIRAELADVLAREAPMDLPAGLAAAIGAEDLSDTDRSLLVVMSRVLDGDLVMKFVGALGARPKDEAARELETLDAGADETTRQHVAERLMPLAARVPALLPDWLDALTGSSTAATARLTIDQAVDDLYNPAQVDVLRRVRRMRVAPPHRTSTPVTGASTSHSPARSRGPGVLISTGGEGRGPHRRSPAPVGASR
ncbi:MerR family transcriptional regulator [Actinotalea sp. K2]|uniref:MerR family transcriptional regulator n=1 Tax=Actinotalea sp. K2 TaxID=2939438 RepID=UPI0020174258|nr:MerR family transcriptional regulator [Actinotalea sp. K2]MCL3862121.1 MerR family transcriptional regulator [Actinotalea sp. K2]